MKSLQHIEGIGNDAAVCVLTSVAFWSVLHPLCSVGRQQLR